MSAETKKSSPPLLGVTVLVTGAAGAAGRETARALARMGANLHLADASESALIETARTFHDEAEGGIRLHAADVAERVDASVLAMDCGDADVVIHLAGTFPETSAGDALSDEAIGRAWQKRVLGATRMIAETDPDLADKGRVLFLLPLPPLPPETGDDTETRMAAAALSTLAAEMNGKKPGLTVEAAAFTDAVAVAARVVSWMDGTKTGD